MSNQTKQIMIWLAIFVITFMTFNLFQGDPMASGSQKIALSDFLSRLENNQVSTVSVQGDTINGTTTDGVKFTTYVGETLPALFNTINKSGAYVEIKAPDTKMNSLFSIFVSWFPMLLLVGVWVFFMRQMQGGSKGMGFGKSKAKMVSDKGPKITFKDVAGIDEAKEELSEIVDFLRNPGKFQKLGGQIPKGCLLIGPPGTGKTMLAKAIAGEANVPFFSISGSDFVEMFVGVGASRVRDMFEQGKRNAPCIIFIDEIDAVGRHRGIGLGGGNDEREQTLNQMLVEMDGFEKNEGVVIIAATNRPDVLDKALLRPGRFDRQITVDNPNVKGREQILRVHMKKVRHKDDVDPKVIARSTPGFSGAKLGNLVNEAALLAARANKKLVEMIDFENAKDKVMMGLEREWSMSTEQKKLTAYHEGGHALVTLYTPASDPIHKATILPRGMALGMVQQLPQDDSISHSYEKMKSEIAVWMAGKVAEEIIFGKEKVTSGASSDIRGATNMARNMVTKWGLSERIGAVYHGDDGDDQYSGGGQKSSPRSEHTSKIIDEEVKRIVDEGYAFAKHILTTHIEQLHLLAMKLMEQETLTGKQIKHLLLGNPIDSKEDPSFPAKVAGSPKVGNKIDGAEEESQALKKNDPTSLNASEPSKLAKKPRKKPSSAKKGVDQE